MILSVRVLDENGATVLTEYGGDQGMPPHLSRATLIGIDYRPGYVVLVCRLVGEPLSATAAENRITVEPGTPVRDAT